MAKGKSTLTVSASVEAVHIQEFLDLISPSIIKVNTDHFICGNTYRCVWALREYPTETSEQAILRHLGEKDGVTMHIYTRHVSPVEEKKIISNAANKNRMRRSSTQDLQQTVTAESNLQDVANIVAQMHRSKEPLLHTAVYIELFSHDPDQLGLLQTEILAELVRSKLNVDRLLLRQQQGFLSVMPSGWNTFGDQFERVLPASFVANLYPFNYSGKTDPNGFCIGRDKFGSNILVDFNRRADDKTNANILILGNSGQGKSYLLKLILTNLRETGMHILALDPEMEYEELTLNLGAVPIPAEEHPQLMLRDDVCGQVSQRVREFTNVDCSIKVISSLYEQCMVHLHWGRFEQAKECLRDMTSLSVLAAAKEYKQLEHCRDLSTVESRLKYGFKEYKNRGKLQNKLSNIRTCLVSLSSSPKVELQSGKLSRAEKYENLAAECDLPAPSPVKNKSQFQLLMNKLPADHKARWFAGAALNTADQAMASVLSTAMSRLNAFLDSEMEQILCFDSSLDTETFCKEKSAIFIVLPEENTTKYFMVSLFLQQLYREMLTVADEYGGKLPNRVMIFADEIGTIPKIQSMEMMFSAGRSRRISMVPIIQSFAQLQKNYGKEGSAIIIDNCQGAKRS